MLGVGFDLHLHLGRAESPCVLAFLSEILKMPTWLVC